MFSPVRLSIARKRRQMTKKSLAEHAGISQVTLTRIETGQTVEPEEDTISLIAKTLRYPKKFFYLDDCEELTPKSVSFRSLSSLTARQRDAALASGALAHMLDDWVTQRFHVPELNLLDLRDETPTTAAAALRRHWGLGYKPIPNIIRLLESKGIRVFSLSESNQNVDAFSTWRNGVPYVFLNTFKSAERSRFDAAHELGHLVMHMHGEQSGREVEREADQFASALLVPREDLIAHLPRIRSLEQLISRKERWGISVSALTRAVFDAGLVSEWHYRDLCKEMSYRGYRKNEPLPKERDHSILWKKILETLWSERITKEHIADDLGLPHDEVESLVGGILPSNVFSTRKLNDNHSHLRAV
ncbi:MAG: XRE family transcriptional regulator [Candidatus Thiodiazotropha sp.]